MPTELSVKEVDKVMTWEFSETIAAMILEPIITGGGILHSSRKLFKRNRRGL